MSATAARLTVEEYLRIPETTEMCCVKWRFVRPDRAAQVSADEYLRGAPDLVVEVLSPRNTADEIDPSQKVT